MLTGNYDITKLHYDGPGEALGNGYGYDIRVEGQTSTNPTAIAGQA